MTYELATSTSISVSTELHDDQVLVTVKGEVDVSTSHDLVDALDQYVHAGIRHFTIDMAEVTFMDSAGVRGLIHLATSRPSITVLIANPAPMIRRLLAVTRLDDHLRVI